MSDTAIEDQMECLEFSAEIKPLLGLVINSLYANKDIFLRELISNASDACDKRRYMLLTDSALSESDTDFKICIAADKDAKTLSIIDNGIGMNRQDMIDNLGMIAQSGTRRFIEALKNNQSQHNMELIGKFGVGFYSAFMVASQVTVESRKAGEKESWVWKSNGEGKFSVGRSDEELPCGTKITLAMKDEEIGFLDKFRIENIVTTYSDHINFPVEFLNENGESERINSKAAIWTRPRDQISAEEHKDFYRSVAHIGGDPWMILHNRNEGAVEYTNLLYIPAIKPFDLFHPDRRCSVKLYVNRVFITEDNVQIVPQYMRFLKGIIDSSDLPLNISRETLQSNHILEKIKNSVVKRVLSELSKRASEDAEDFSKFWNNFGAVLKEGLCEGMSSDRREELLSVCRFNSTLGNLVSLDDYISRMKSEQKCIYYLTGSSVETIKNSPQLEGFSSCGVEVLLLTDQVDDFWTSVVTEYRDYSLRSVTRFEQDLEQFSSKESPTEKEEIANNEKEVDESILNLFKEVLGESVGDVKSSKKLTNSPVCLSVSDSSMDIRMERFLREQKQLGYKTPKILEVNLRHNIVMGLRDKYRETGKNDLLVSLMRLLFYQACIIEGEEIVDSSDYAACMLNVMNQAL